MLRDFMGIDMNDYFVDRWLSAKGFTSGMTAVEYAKDFAKFMEGDTGGPVTPPSRQAMGAILRRIGCKVSLTQPRRYFLQSFAVHDARARFPDLAPVVI